MRKTLDSMKPMSWIIATAVSATMMIGYVHAFVYPRTEGEKLELSVRDLRLHLHDDIREIRKDIKELLRRTKP